MSQPQKLVYAQPTLPSGRMIYFTLDPSGRILAVDLPGATYLGYSPEALIGQPIFDVFDPEDCSRLQVELTAIVQELDQISRGDFCLLRGNGDSLPVRATAQMLQARQNQGILLLSCEELNCEPFDWVESHAAWLSSLEWISPVGIFRMDARGHCIYVNQRWCEIATLPASEAMGVGWVRAIHPDDRERVFAEWYDTLQENRPFQSQHRFQRGDGSIVWVLSQAIIERGSDGSVLSYIGSITDITQRQQAEEALRQQAEREQIVSEIVRHIRRSLNLKQVLNTTVSEVRHFLQADRVLIFRFETNWSGTVLVESVGSAWSSLLGTWMEDTCFPASSIPLYQRGQTRSIPNLKTEGLSPCYINMLSQFQVQAALTVPILQGEQLWGLLVAHQCREPRQWQPFEIDLLKQLAAQVGIAIQQSELYRQVRRLNADLERQVQQRTAELELASEFEATLKRITDRVRDSLDEDQILQTAVRELAMALGVISCNAALYDLEQRTSKVRYEYTTSMVSFQGRVVQMDNFPEGYHQLRQGQYFQFCSLMPIPSRGQVAMLACPILDDQGVMGDLWLVSQAYHAFHAQDIRLVQQVANQCAIALRQARLFQKAQTQVEELEKLNRLKDDFLSTVSHELRTPMSNIKMATQMMEVTLRRQNLLDPESGPLAKYFQILHSECQRETNLINDLLDLSRLESSTEPLVLTTISLDIWMPHFVQTFVERIHDQAQTLQIEIPNRFPPFTTDLSRFERILRELMNNACKYTPSGGQIALGAAIEGDRVQLQISNTGAEISPGELIRIFDKFYRIPNNNPWKHGGTGLGLALVKRLVETLGGSVQAASSSGRISFTIDLPRLPHRL